MAGLTFTKPASQARIERIQQLLRQQPASLQEIADAVFISVRYAREYIDHLHGHGRLHVCQYRRDLRKRYSVWKPLYAWGAGADAPPPDNSPRVRQAEQRAKIAADPDMHDRHKARRRAAKIKPRRDWTASWIPTK